MTYPNLLCAAVAVVLMAGCAATPSAAPAGNAPAAAIPVEATADAGSSGATPTAVPSPEAVTAPPSASGHTAAAYDPNEKVCRRRQLTGSRFPETRCQTRAEWIAEEDTARQTAEKLQRTRSTPQM